MSLLVMAVAASLASVSLRLPSRVETEISLILFTARADALRRPLLMSCVLTPCSTCSLISLRISPARTTTEVVPSPTSASWDRAMSTRMRAAGWTMSRSYGAPVSIYVFNTRKASAHGTLRTFMTVAPSLVIVCLPFSSTINRSPPYGPRVGFTVPCTATQALMLDRIWP